MQYDAILEAPVSTSKMNCGRDLHRPEEKSILLQPFPMDDHLPPNGLGHNCGRDRQNIKDFAGCSEKKKRVVIIPDFPMPRIQARTAVCVYSIVWYTSFTSL